MHEIHNPHGEIEVQRLSPDHSEIKKGTPKEFAHPKEALQDLKKLWLLVDEGCSAREVFNALVKSGDLKENQAATLMLANDQYEQGITKGNA